MDSETIYPVDSPKKGDIVIAKVIAIETSYVLYNLLEYDKEAMMADTEVSRNKHRSVRSCVQMGQKDYAEVLLIDENKGFIDILKKTVTEEEIEDFKKHYTVSKKLYDLFSKWSKQCEKNLVKDILWEHYDEEDKYMDMLTDKDWMNEIPTEISTSF